MAFFRVFPVVAALLVVLATCSSSGAAAAHAKTKTVKLVNYEFENRVAPNNTVVVSATPSGNLSHSEFGTVRVVTNVLRETMASDSAVLGSVVGLVNTLRDGSLFLTFNFVYDSTKMVSLRADYLTTTVTSSWTGTLAVQGRLSAAGSGELVVTGGSGDFRFAQGYCDTTLVEASDPANVVFKNVLHLKL